MAIFTYPTNAVLREIAQDKTPALMANRPIFDIFPVVDVDANLVEWEQEDNYTGLQQVRGLNGEPANVKQIGSKLYQMTPGAYGEFDEIDERQLTSRRQLGTFNQPISIADLVMRKQDRLLGRELDRMELNGWTLLTTGTFSVYHSATGALLHSDTYPIQVYTAAVPWATVATATPLANLRAVKLLARGHSVNFGAGAKAYANQVTINTMLSNTNNADIYGRRSQGLSTLNSLEGLNTLYMADGLPQLVQYDEGYLNDSGMFVPFIPDNKVVVIGQRPNNTPVGEYQKTRNANNPNLEPGSYMKVVDNGDEEVPRKIEIHRGHNGGIALLFPSAIVVLNV